MEGAMTPSEVSTALGLSALKSRTWAIFKTSALKGDGLEEAMDWWGFKIQNVFFWLLVKWDGILEFVTLLG